MNVNAIQQFKFPVSDQTSIDKTKSGNFNNIFSDFLGQVNQSQISAEKTTDEFLQGGNVQLQDVMIAGEQAKTSLELLMEIRNKALDMYKQLTSMQV